MFAQKHLGRPVAWNLRKTWEPNGACPRVTLAFPTYSTDNPQHKSRCSPASNMDVHKLARTTLICLLTAPHSCCIQCWYSLPVSSFVTSVTDFKKIYLNY